jgi:hypothetical protein
MPVIIRGECGLSSLFAILLRSHDRLRASQIAPRRTVASGTTQTGSARIGCAGCEVQLVGGEGDGL